MAFDISVREVLLKHDGGTKFYELLVLEGLNGNSVLIKRWGPTAKQFSGGEKMFEQHTTKGAAGRICDSMIKKKMGREYRVTADSVVDYEAARVIGILRRKSIDAGMAKHIAKFATGSGVMEYDDSDRGEVEIVFENPVMEPSVDRTGDKEWASW